MAKCDHLQCPGHLAKFSSCIDEAIWQETLDMSYPVATTGTVEFEGHYSLMDYSFDVAITIEDGVDTRSVQIPVGWYVVQATEGGFVYVTRYDTEAEARLVFDEADDAYGLWAEENDL